MSQPVALVQVALEPRPAATTLRAQGRARQHTVIANRDQLLDHGLVTRVCAQVLTAYRVVVSASASQYSATAAIAFPGPTLAAANQRRTTSTFTRDIAYSNRPAAARASSWSRKSRPHAILPSRTSKSQPHRATASAPLVPAFAL